MRRAEHEALLCDVLTWRQEMASKINSIGNSFEAVDGGASRSELLVSACGKKRETDGEDKYFFIRIVSAF